MKAFLPWFSAILLSISLSGQMEFNHLATLEYEAVLTDNWGYVHADSTEYALVGQYHNLSIVNLSDPSNPVEEHLVPLRAQDTKTWENYAYTVSDGLDFSLGIVNLENLPDTVSYQHVNLELPDGEILTRCHNLWIDEDGFAYLCGCSANSGGIVMFDLTENPEQPNFVGFGISDLAHDVFVRDNIAYTSEFFKGQLAIYDVSDKQNVFLLGTHNTPHYDTHHAWLSDDGQTVFTADESPGAPITAFDVSDFSDINERDRIIHAATEGDGIIPHNVYVYGDLLVIAYYQNGVMIVDAADPNNLIELGSFKTSQYTTGGSFSFHGAWAAYPFFPSGTLIVSDIEEGLFVFQPEYELAGRIEGVVTSSSNGDELFDVKVEILGSPSYSMTDFDGFYHTGIAPSGTYEVKFSKRGYGTKIETVTLEGGETLVLDVSLTPYSIKAKVVNALTGQPISVGRIQANTSEYEVLSFSNSLGEFLFYVSDGLHEIAIGKWGYQTIVLENQLLDIDNNDLGIIELEPKIEDNFALQLGWHEYSVGASQGRFERAIPLGVYSPDSILIQTENDLELDAGRFCYQTGASDLLNDTYLRNGYTSILSPKFDMSEMTEPTLSYNRWFYSGILPEEQDYDDSLRVKLINGMDTVLLEMVGWSSPVDIPSWEEKEFKVLEYINPTDEMQILFEVGSFENDELDTTEVAIDYFRAWDANPTNSEEILSPKATVQIFPNPSSGQFNIAYNLNKASEEANVIIYNTLGQQVYQENLTRKEGLIEILYQLKQGLYFVSLEEKGSRLSKTHKIIIQN